MRKFRFLASLLLLLGILAWSDLVTLRAQLPDKKEVPPPDSPPPPVPSPGLKPPTAMSDVFINGPSFATPLPKIDPNAPLKDLLPPSPFDRAHRGANTGEQSEPRSGSALPSAAAGHRRESCPLANRPADRQHQSSQQQEDGRFPGSVARGTLRPERLTVRDGRCLWHQYRVELFPHYGQFCGITDVRGFPLQFPAAFRQSRNGQEKGIVKLER